MKIKAIGHLVKTNPIKPNSRKAKMNVILNTTKVYGNFRLYGRRENKPNSNPVLSAACPERSRMGRMGQFQTQLRPFCLLRRRLPHEFYRILVKLGKDLLEYEPRQTAT